MSLGERIRSYRLERKRTVTSLAQEVGVTTSQISQIERDLSSPSVSTLKKIALALNVKVSNFFDSESDGTEIVLIRKAERKKLSLPQSHVIYELLSPNLQKDLQMFMVDLDVEGITSDLSMGHGGDECNLIIGGTVEAILGSEKYILNDGDSIFYPGNIPHRFRNIGDTPVTIISAISPAEF